MRINEVEEEESQRSKFQKRAGAAVLTLVT